MPTEAIPQAPQPYGYQRTGIKFLADRRRAVLADDAGLGKSMQMIRAAERLDLGRILVLCPAIARVSWKLQFRQWDTRQRPIYLFPDETDGTIPSGDVALIVTLDWLSQPAKRARLVRLLGRAAPMDVAYVDEVHYLKNPSANRTKAVYGARGDFKNAVLAGVARTWVASATLTPNHAGELYSHMRALLPDVLRRLFRGDTPTYRQFIERYCTLRHNGFGYKVVGNNRQTIPELRAALQPHLLLRRKADVLTDLPAISCVPLPFEIADPADRKWIVQNFLNNIPPEKITSDDDTLTILGAALADPAIAARRRALGLAKTQPAIAWAMDFLSQTTRKLVVFAHHRDVIDALENGLSTHHPVVVKGGVGAKRAAHAVDRFQTDPRCRVFIGQTKAAGTAITLTAASNVLLVEPDWTPANNYQAISRCHRIGQASGVVARFAYADGTIDQHISNVLRRRAADQVQLFGAAPQGFTEKE